MKRPSRYLLSLAAAIPFLLLHQAEDVRMLTRLERDGSGLRMLWARGNVSRLDEVVTRAREATPQYDDQVVATEGSQFIIARTWRPHTLSLTPDSTLTILDIPQAPLSLYNVYEWREDIKIYSDTATQSELAGAQKARLVYVLEMPGRVVESSVSPRATVHGNRVVWVLTADRESYTLSATSRMLRWEILLVLLYILAVALIKAIQLIARWARSRPRRI